MQEIVVNRCNGRFSLSYLALKEYLKLKESVPYFYVGKEGYLYANKVYIQIDPEKAEDEYIKNGYVHISVKDLGKECSAKELNDNYFSQNDIDRTDPDLISVVKDLKEKANTHISELEVIEIPDGVDWEITENNGFEQVEERHKIW